MMKKLAILLLSFASFSAVGQQMDMHTQYIFNNILVNPGATGGYDYIPVQINYRKQWTSFPGAPTTQSVSCHSEVFRNMGFGGNFFNDNSGPSRRTGMNVNGAYHLRLSRDKQKYIGFGMGVSLAQHSIDETKLTTYLPNDQAVLRGFNNQFVPDANAGVFFKLKKNAFVGISAYNLVQSNRDLFDFDTRLNNTMARTYFLFGGYDFYGNRNVGLKTSLLVRAIETGTVQFDLNAIGVYKNLAWFGVSYRHLDAVAVLAGVQLSQFKLGYSYDYTISDIGQYSNGSHEIFLEMQLYEPKVGNGKRNWFKKRQKAAPNI